MTEEEADRFPGPDADKDRATRDTPGVIAPPPLICLGSILIGVTLHYLWPWRMFPLAFEAAFGSPVILVAIVLFMLSVREFRAAGTSVQTRRPTTTIIRTGPYRLSRNPIYLSFALLHLGIGIWANSAWLLGTLILTLVLISYGVIAREERYLTGKFGEEYVQYKASVRRWI